MNDFKNPFLDDLVSVSQNPFSDETLLQFSVMILPAKLKLIDTRQPKTVFEKIATQPLLPFGSGLPPGTYLLSIESVATATQYLELKKVAPLKG